MMGYHKLALVAVGFIFLFSISMLLSSCGSNSPAGTPVAQSGNPTVSKSTQQGLVSASSTPASITIKTTPQASTTYTVHMSSDLVLNASNTQYTVLQPVASNTYQAALSKDKIYSFSIFVQAPNIDDCYIIEIISQPGQNDTSRKDTIITLPMNKAIKPSVQSNQSTGTNAPVGMNAMQSTSNPNDFICRTIVDYVCTYTLRNQDTGQYKEFTQTVHVVNQLWPIIFPPLIEYSATPDLPGLPWGIWSEGKIISKTVTLISCDPPANPVKKISISPPKATIYIHHTDIKKKQQQFTAIKTMTDGGIIDATQQVNWGSSDKTAADISNMPPLNGLAYAITKPGSTAITASTADGIEAINKPELCVECWEYTQYRQNVGAWKDDGYAYHESPYDVTYATDLFDSQAPRKSSNNQIPFSIGDRGCLLTVMAMALTAAGTPCNPRDLDLWLKQNNGYDLKNNVLVEKAIDYGNNPNITGTTVEYTELSVNATAIYESLQNCQMIIAHVKGNNGTFANPPGHYILIIKHDKNKPYYVYDPWYRGAGAADMDDLSTHYTFLGYKEIYTR